MTTGKSQNEIVIYEVVESFVHKNKGGWDFGSLRVPTAIVAIALATIY